MGWNITGVEGQKIGEGTEAGGSVHDLRVIIGQLAAQIDASDKRNAEALEALRGRLEAMGEGVKQARETVPDSYRDTFGRIEEAIQELAGRLARAAGAVGAVAAGSSPGAETGIETGATASAAEIAATVAATLGAPEAAHSAASQASQVPLALRSAMPDFGVANIAHATEADPFDFAAHSLDGEVWDAASAEALTAAYEEDGVTVGISPTSAVPLAPTGTAAEPSYGAATTGEPAGQAAQSGYAMEATDEPAEVAGLRLAHASEPAAIGGQGGDRLQREWFEQRFTALADRIEQALAVGGAASFAELADRIEALEARMVDVLKGVATRSDVESLSAVEAHLSDLARQFDTSKAELSRVGDIEREILSLAEQLNESQAPAAHAEPDFARIAEMVARELAERQVATKGQAEPPKVAPDGELRRMVQRLIETQSSNEAHTATILDTMQQALIRLLDRMDSVEQSQITLIDTVRAPRAVAGIASLPTPGVADEAAYGWSLEAEAAREAADDRTVAREAVQDAPPVAAAEPARDTVAADVPADVGHDADIVTEAEELADEAIERLVAAQAAHALDDDAGSDDDAERAEAAPAPTGPTIESAPAEVHSPAARQEAGPAQSEAARRTRESIVAAARRAAEMARQAEGLEPAAARPRGAAAQGDRFARLGVTQAPVVAEADIAKPSIKVAAPTRRHLSGDEAAPAGAETKSGGRSRLWMAGIALVMVAAGFGATLLLDGQSSQQVAGERQLVTPETAAREASETVNGQAPAEGGAVDQATRAPAPAVAPAPGGGRSSLETSTNVAAAAPGTAPVVPASLVPQGADGQLQSATAGLAAAANATQLPPAQIGPLSLRVAAADGDPSAEFEVGARFAEGKGVTQDFKQAIKWYERSAGRGFALAQYRLATFYERGLGGPADIQRAKIWYERAAEQGTVKAMHNLAVLVASQANGAPDYKAAAKWFEMAAEHGLADSQFNLAILYLNGLGVTADELAAYKWLSLAARSGDKEADQRKIALGKSLAADAKAQATSAVRAWRPRPLVTLANDPFAAGQKWQTAQQGGQAQ